MLDAQFARHLPPTRLEQFIEPTYINQDIHIVDINPTVAVNIAGIFRKINTDYAGKISPLIGLEIKIV